MKNEKFSDLSWDALQDRLRAGDPEARNEIARRLLAVSKTGSQPGSYTVRAALKLVGNLEKGQEVSTPELLMHYIKNQLKIDDFRKANRGKRIPPEKLKSLFDSIPELGSSQRTPAELAEDSETLLGYSVLLENLDSVAKQIFLMRKSGESFDGISKTTNIGLSDVKRLYNQTVEEIRRQLELNEDE